MPLSTYTLLCGGYSCAGRSWEVLSVCIPTQERGNENKQAIVYFMANASNSVFYVDVTSNLIGVTDALVQEIAGQARNDAEEGA